MTIFKVDKPFILLAKIKVKDNKFTKYFELTDKKD